MLGIRNIKIFFLLSLVSSCALKSTLNLKDHSFSKKADKIVWIQVGGLAREHLAFLKFYGADSTKTTSLEESHCAGDMWNYNIKDLRPESYSGFLSQLLASKDIKNNCSDFDKKSAWKYFKEVGFDTAIFEGPMAKEKSLLKSYNCGKGYQFLEGTTFWSMSKNKQGEFFHYQGDKKFKTGIYYDQSCQDGTCYTGIFRNVQSIWKRYKKNKFLFIIRNESINEALKNKDIALAREGLVELERLLQFFLDKKKKDERILLLVSSSESRAIELPSKGVAWADFEKTGKNIIYKRPQLLSPIYANGRGAENFCGIFEESDTLKRILWLPGRDKNIFKNIKF